MSKKFFIILAILLLLCGVAYANREEITAYINKKPTDPGTTPGTGSTGNSGSNTTVPAALDENLLLRKGMGSKSSPSPEVKKLQGLLNTISVYAGTSTITEDGVFGSGTEAKLKQYNCGFAATTLKAANDRLYKFVHTGNTGC